jgi:hypothetical protein
MWPVEPIFLVETFPLEEFLNCIQAILKCDTLLKQIGVGSKNLFPAGHFKVGQELSVSCVDAHGGDFQMRSTVYTSTLCLDIHFDKRSCMLISIDFLDETIQSSEYIHRFLAFQQSTKQKGA